MSTPSDDAPDSMSAEQMLTVDELVAELKRRFPSGLILGAADPMGYLLVTDGPDHAALGLAELIADQLRDRYRGGDFIGLEDLNHGEHDQDGDE